LFTAVSKQYGCARATCATASAAKVTVDLENMVDNVDAIVRSQMVSSIEGDRSMGWSCRRDDKVRGSEEW